MLNAEKIPGDISAALTLRGIEESNIQALTTNESYRWVASIRARNIMAIKTTGFEF